MILGKEAPEVLQVPVEALQVDCHEVGDHDALVDLACADPLGYHAEEAHLEVPMAP